MPLRRSAKREILRDWYMVTVDADEDNMVEIPKRKMQKRWCGDLTHEQFFHEAAMQQGQLHLQSLPQMVAGVMSDNKNLQFEMMTRLRELLSIAPNPPINEVVQSGVVPRIVQFLSGDDFPQLQLEATWALTNVASGTSENTKVVIDSGAVPLFIKLLCSSADEDVKEQAVWALGNVAGDSPQRCDFVLSHGAMLCLLTQFKDNAKLSMIRTGTWTLLNFCGGEKPVEQTLPALLVLQRLVHSTDEQVLIDACWALSHLSNGVNAEVQPFIPRLIELLAHPSPSVLIPALITIGNIVSGDDMQTHTLLMNYYLLPRLLNLLTNTSKKSIKKEICWTISNITAGNTSQIHDVLQSGFIPPLIHLLQQDELDITREAAWAISNATSGGNRLQIMFLVSQGCIEPLCDLLTCSDPRIVMVCLEGLENILEVGEAEKNEGDINLYTQMICDAGRLEKIENLQKHDSREIYDKAVEILDGFWEERDEVCDDVGGASEYNGLQFGSQNGAVAPTGRLSSLLEMFYGKFYI